MKQHATASITDELLQVILNEGSSTVAASTVSATTTSTTTTTTTTTVMSQPVKPLFEITKRKFERNVILLYTSQPRPTTTTTRPRPKSPTPTAQDDVNRCKGTCVTGFFSYLCDYIDSKAQCANGGKCCITRREDMPNAKNSTATNKPSTTARPSTTTPASTTIAGKNASSAATTTAPPTTTTAAPLKRCPGVCLPGLMSAFCSQPSVVIKEPANLCERGAICCDSKTREGSGGSGSRPETGVTTVRPSRPSTKSPSSSSISDLINNPLTSLLAGPLLSSLAGAALQRPSAPSSKTFSS